MILTLKRLDLGIQIALFSIGLLSWLREEEGIVFAMYFALGGWQVGSCLVHHFALPQSRNAVRKHYAWVAATIGLLTLITLPAILISGIALLLVTPFVAVWYGLICYNEIKNFAWRNSFHMKN